MRVRTCFFTNVVITILLLTIFKKSLGTKFATSRVRKLSYGCLKEKDYMLFHQKRGYVQTLVLTWAHLLFQCPSEYTGAERSHVLEEQQFLHYTVPSAQRKGALTINSSQFLLPHIATVHPKNQLQHIQIQGT